MDLLVAARFLGRCAWRWRHWRRLGGDRQVGHVVMVLGEGSRHRQLRVERILVTGRHARRCYVRLKAQLLVLVREELRLEFWNAHRRATARGYLCALRTDAAVILFRLHKAHNHVRHFHPIFHSTIRNRIACGSIIFSTVDIALKVVTW